MLRLSCGRGNEPVLIGWPVGEKPVFVEIGWNDGYEVRATYEVETEDRTTGDKVAGIDLGERHLAAISTGDDCFLLNGGELRALRKYQNQTKAKLDSKINRKEIESVEEAGSNEEQATGSHRQQNHRSSAQAQPETDRDAP